VHSLSLDLKGITTIARGSVDATTATSDTAPAYMMATSGHVDNDDGNGDTVTEARKRTSGHNNNKATGNTTTMNMTTAMDGITVADTMTTGTASTTTLHNIGDDSSGGNVAPAIPSSIVARAQGPIAFLEERAAILSQRADEAAALAREAVTDAQDFNNAHASIVAKHRKMFLERAFGIKSDGTVITELKKYKSVKTYEKYNDMIHVMFNWGDDNYLKEASSGDPVAAAIRKFCKSNNSGYNYVRDFKIEVAETLDESQRLIFKHKKSGGIVSHMINIFDIIHEAHSRQGHMKAEKTLATLQPMHYSPTMELCTLFCLNCFVCQEKHPNVPPTKGAKKPILSSEFSNIIQVDLIDMRVMRKLDVYGKIQCWIMTVKDHSTGLVYLCALQQKKAIFVAAKLEKYFGFIGFPEIFHTGVYTITFM
jgi:hypothetical protein